MDHGPPTATGFRVPTAVVADAVEAAEGAALDDRTGGGGMPPFVPGTGRSSVRAPPSTPRGGSTVLKGVLAAAWTLGGRAAETGGVPTTDAAMATADKSTGIATAGGRFHGR